MLKIPFDPLKRAEEVEKIVMKNLKRKYYRFRFSRYYGGIVTADAVGCCFLCGYCWNYFRNLNPEKFGNFYSSEEVANELIKISKRKNCKRFRISGAEPILGKRSFDHFMNVIKIVEENLKEISFILETNGFILGFYPEFIDEMIKFKDFLVVRISIKGWDEKSFELISGSNSKYFFYPLKALKELVEKGMNAWPAVMFETFKGKGIEILSKKLRELNIRPEELEIEYLEKYPFVVENLKKRKINFV